MKKTILLALAFVAGILTMGGAARRGDGSASVPNTPMHPMTRKMILFFIVASCGALVACGTTSSNQWSAVMPGKVAEYTSAYDGTKHRKINPLFVAAIGSKWASAGFSVGLYSINEDYFLLVKMPEIIGIESVGINVDGQRFVSRSDNLPNFDVDENPLTNFGAESTQAFSIPKEWIVRMTQGKRVIIQVRTSEGVVEGNFSTIGCDVSGSACEAFSNLLQK